MGWNARDSFSPAFAIPLFGLTDAYNLMALDLQPQARYQLLVTEFTSVNMLCAHLREKFGKDSTLMLKLCT
jgi:hypothetical protein